MLYKCLMFYFLVICVFSFLPSPSSNLNELSLGNAIIFFFQILKETERIEMKRSGTYSVGKLRYGGQKKEYGKQNKHFTVIGHGKDFKFCGILHSIK